MQMPHEKIDLPANQIPDHRHQAKVAIDRPKTKSLFRKHPVIFLTGIWLVVMVLGWLSMAEIISPGANAPLPKTPIAQAQREKNSSLGVLGAIAASCAVVSVVLAQKMEHRR